MVEQTERENQIEAAKVGDLRVFHIGHAKIDSGMAPARLGDVIFARVDGGYLKPHIAQRGGEIPDPAPHVQSRAQAQLLLPLRKEAAQEFAPRGHERGLPGTIEDKGLRHCQFPV